ncbi:unnamed protein product [Parnassius mnemosyne]|uniref:DNA helicase n=1 Tax=Parnassius mnemosyne TaxID=213953 RepID=A0AAV1KHT3_9NEOP
MADAVPVCDVLCEAMEYLSKLGSNLKVRSENLKEKKIRKDRLKNTHAVQKAANKVLLICELSRKSLDNVETGVKNLLSHIDALQAPTNSGGKTSRYSKESNIPYEYFEYESKKLKIRKKILLKHYTSVKVVAKPMPSTVFNEYPVYYDCKLFQLNKENAKQAQIAKKVAEDTVKKYSRGSDSESGQTKDLRQEFISENSSNNPSDTSQTCNRLVDSVVNTTVENSKNEDNQDNSRSNNSNESLRGLHLELSTEDKGMEGLTNECGNDVGENNFMRNKKSEEELEIDKESKNECKNMHQSRKKYKHIQVFDDSSDSNKGEDNNDSKTTQLEENESTNLRQDNKSLSLLNINEQSRTSNNDLYLDNGTNDEDQKNEAPSETSETKKTFIKCVNIDKLLDESKKANISVVEIDDDDDEEERLKMKTKQKEEKSDKVRKSLTKQITNKPKKKSRNILTDDSSDENYWEQKREEVKLFKPKQFRIDIHRLPNFSVDFLKTHNLNKIVQNGGIVCDLETLLKKLNEDGKENLEPPLSKNPSMDEIVDENLKEPSNNKIIPENSRAETMHVKNSLLNDSDSDKSVNKIMDNDLLKEAESIRNALLNDSDSDEHSDLENRKQSGVETDKNDENSIPKEVTNDTVGDQNFSENSTPKEVMSNTMGDQNFSENHEAESRDNSSTSPQHNKDPNKVISSSLLNDSSVNASLSSDNKNKKDVSPQPNEVKSSLMNDSSDNASLKSDSKNVVNTSPQPNEDPNKVKSSLMNDSSDNDSLKSNNKNKKDPSPQLNEDPNEVKSSLLNDSSDSALSASNKRKRNSEKDTSPQLNEDSEKVKSSLLNDSSDNTSISLNKRKRSIEKVSPHKSKRRHIMESMHAKKMLLTYSSSSDTEDEQLRSALKEIKESLLKGISSDEESKPKNLQLNKDSTSESEKNDVKELNKNSSKNHKTSSGSEGERILKKKQKSSKIRNKRFKNDDTDKSEADNDENTKSSLCKMGHSRAKPGSSSSQNSDTQDANDKDIDGLTNLNTLSKTRRRRGSTSSDQTADTAQTRSSKSGDMPKVPRIQAESLLKAESSSDAASIAGSEEGEEAEELPTVSMSAINGDGIPHLAKDDLLGESDSSSSHNEKDTASQEESKKSDTEEEDNVKLKRRKAHAISSDSEAGSSRRRERGHKMSDFEDSDDDGSEPAVKKKRKKKPSDSDDQSSDDSGKKKRRRIKNVDDSDGSDSDTENEGRNKHGRKNIRKVMGKNQLEEATKKAAREEKERIARIAERQKMYNNLEFDESGKPDEVILEKVVLDFDPETKEPLIEVDRGLVKKLKPHQANGIKFMWDACFESVKRIKKDKGSGCILAHCMGLGKTLQVVSLTHTLLTHSALTGVQRVLVVCPLSTVLNWVNEFRIWLKHTENEYDVDVYELSRYKQNSERAFQLQQWFESGGVCVLGYEMFRNLSADNSKKFKKKMLKSFQESLVDPGPDLVVCDEGHLLKNEKTSLSQSMNRVRTRRRIVLTGTPLQNNLKEYYCMVQFVKPNLLGKYNEYLNRFVNPITNGQYTDSTEHDIRVMKRRSHVLHKMLDGAVQRRDYGVLAPFLPPKHEYVLFITLSEVQIKLYQHYLDNYSRRPLPGKSSGFLFPDFQSLQRIWTHPLVLKYNSERYEIMQQKKREREEEEDSEGSLADFIDDDSTPNESSTEESSDDFSDASDDSRKKNKKKKAAKKGKVKDSKVTTRRGTRANPVEHLEDEEKPIESLETKYENPTEWWMKLVTDDELEDMRNSHKLVLLFDILRQCETIGDKLLVFSQSLYSLDLIEHFLGKVDEATQEGRIDEKLGGHVGSWSPGIDYFRLDGSTSCENRSIWCKNFNREDNPRARLFLISTRAGGLGINLVAANRVVIFDVSWNPSHDVQSIFRVYRFGQKKPCYIYRFLAMGTMEEKIYERQVTKQAISKRVIDEQQIDRHYAENDLAELYKFEPRPPVPRPLPPLPRDRLFAEMLREHDAQIYKYHEHDSLLENKEEETLSEEERKAAWEDFENEKNRPPPAPFPAPWQMANGMVPGLLAQQQQQLAFAALGAMLRKDMPNINENQIRDMLPLIYNSNPGMFGGYDYGLMQKMGEIYKYAQPGIMNPAMMNPVMNPGAGAGNLGGSSGLQYEPPWQRQQQQQQQMRLQQMMQQQHQNMGAKYYAGGLGSRDPVAMALQQQRAREIMLGERARPRGRPPLQRAPAAPDVVNLADSD